MSLPDTPDRNQAEPALISTSLEVEQLDTNLFRSKTLYKPSRHARGVFGGQVISQALVCANNRVDPAFSLHSLHCYFLLSASPALPVLYYVELLRDGKTYVTRSVKAVQNGRIIFILIASYQKPERDQPGRQWAMPPSIPPPEECQTEESVILAKVNDKNLSAKARERWEEVYQDRIASPVDIRVAPSVSTDRGTLHAYWMRTRHAPKFDAPLQKCVLAYISDIKLIGSAALDLGLSGSGKGQNRLGMLSSLDHNMWFYMDDFDCAEWVLYTMESPVAGSGRGVSNGHFFTRQGKLIAVTSQEGVLRAALPATKPKL